MNTREYIEITPKRRIITGFYKVFFNSQSMKKGMPVKRKIL